jgi:hypothetical protein
MSDYKAIASWWTGRSFTRLGLIALSVGIVVMGWMIWKDRPAPVPPSAPVQVNDSTQLLAAQLELARGELRALRDAAKQVHGKPVAGVRIEIRPETIYVERTNQPTDSLQDGTRIAKLVDTTKEGVQVEISASAPPSPAPLGIGYRLVLPPFAPEVGFILKDGRYYAVVTVPGRSFTTSQAFFTVPSVRRFGIIAGGQIMTQDSRLLGLGFAGVDLHLNSRSSVMGAVTTGNNALLEYRYRVF